MRCMALRGGDDVDLMGMNGDLLFADPLGVRAGSTKDAGRNGDRPAMRAPVPRQAEVASKRPANKVSDADSAKTPELELRQEDEEEESDRSWLGALLWGFVAGGKQCCSIRDRSNPQDEAAKRAATLGRPPSRFPPPETEPSEATRPLRQPSPEIVRPPVAAERASGAASGTRGLFPDDSDSRQPVAARMDEARRQERLRSPSPPEDRRPHVNQMDSDMQSPLHTQSPMATRSKVEPAPLGRQRALPRNWQWPAWCLNFKTPIIEVYVVDDETGEGRWVNAEPLSRVVDNTDSDAYLCAEYDWDGEGFEQDFPPEHVRKRGQTKSVFEVLLEGETQGSGGREAPRPRPPDTGGGVSRLLDDSR